MIPDRTILSIPTSYERAAPDGLNVGTEHIDVMVRYVPDLPTRGQVRTYPYGPLALELREWNEQVFLHEMLHVATRPYFEGGYYHVVDDPHGHRLVNRIEVAMVAAGFRLGGAS